MSRYYSLETIRANAKDVTLTNGAKHRCIDPDALLDIEPADVRENVKGEWIEKKPMNFGKCINGLGSIFKCSVCGEEILCCTTNYCPNCGADMRGGDAK